MSDRAGRCLVFDSFELWPERGLLLRGGVEVDIAPKPLAVLTHLVHHRERVVPRDELLDTVWPGVSVSDAAFASVVRDLRRVLRDDAARPRLVATVRGRGLRFVGDVREGAGDASRAPGPGTSWRDVAEDLEQALRALEVVWTSRGRDAARHGSGAPRERGDLLVALARARWAGGATDAARQGFEDAAELARRMGDAEILARAALGYAGRTDVTPGVRRDAVARMEEALAALGSGHRALRAELLARLGTELYYEDEARSRRHTAEALQLAEGGEPTLLAYVLTARHFADQRPAVHPRERRAWAGRAVELAGRGPASDVLALALQNRMLDRLELADRAGFEEDLARYGRVVDALDQPFFAWIRRLLAGSHALLAGRTEEAERAAQEALDLGRGIGSPNAAGAFAAQLLAIRRHQGRLHELVPLLRDVSRGPEALPAFRAAWAGVTAAAGDAEEARRALDAVMARGLDDLPRDQNWLGALAVLAPAAAAEPRHATRVRDLLRPHAGRLVVAGFGAAVLGAVDHHLGVLETALDASEAADAHLRAAAELHAGLGAPLWVEATRRAREQLSRRTRRRA